MAKEIFLSDGDVLMHEGQTSTNMYYLLDGTMDVTKVKSKKVIKLGSVFSGELVGEVSFLDEGPRSATVKANGPCKLIEIPRDNFLKTLEDQPKWIKALILTLSKRLRKANKLIKI